MYRYSFAPAKLALDYQTAIARGWPAPVAYYYVDTPAIYGWRDRPYNTLDDARAAAAALPTGTRWRILHDSVWVEGSY